MKKISLLLLIILFALLTGCAAQKNVAVFDLSRAAVESDAGKEAEVKSQAYEGQLAQRLEPLRQELIRMQEYYKANEGKLSDADKTNLNDLFQRGQAEFERGRQALGAELEKFNSELSSNIVSKIYEIMLEVAKEKRLNLVIDIDSTYFQDNMTDLTDEVIARYNVFFKNIPAESQE